MGRASNKKNKTIYQLVREDLGLTREKASELLDTSPERLERVENEKLPIYPEEVLKMSSAYHNPNLCNYYCANKCPIGQKYVPEVEVKDLSKIILEILASLNSMNRKQERLIEITADGDISKDEIEDFVYIQEELEKISITVETLQFWSERMLAEGKINKTLYEEYKAKKH